MCTKQQHRSTFKNIQYFWQILQFQRVIFELEYISSTEFDNDLDLDDTWDSGPNSGVVQSQLASRQRILLRGEMKYIEEWDKIAFLGNPL